MPFNSKTTADLFIRMYLRGFGIDYDKLLPIMENLHQFSLFDPDSLGFRISPKVYYEEIGLSVVVNHIGEKQIPYSDRDGGIERFFEMFTDETGVELSKVYQINNGYSAVMLEGKLFKDGNNPTNNYVLPIFINDRRYFELIKEVRNSIIEALNSGKDASINIIENYDPTVDSVLQRCLCNDLYEQPDFQQRKIPFSANSRLEDVSSLENIDYNDLAQQFKILSRQEGRVILFRSPSVVATEIHPLLGPSYPVRVYITPEKIDVPGAICFDSKDFKK